MVKKHKEKRLVEQEAVDEIVCNRCGKPIHKAKNMCGDMMFVDCVHYDANYIFGAMGVDKYVSDFCLCEDCLNEINRQFKIPVKII